MVKKDQWDLEQKTHFKIEKKVRYLGIEISNKNNTLFDNNYKKNLV